jgi:hypothetical protein
MKKLIGMLLMALPAWGQAQTFDFNLTLIQAVPGSPGPVPLVFDGTFTDINSVISNVDITTQGGHASPYSISLNSYLNGAFVMKETNPAADFFLTVKLGQPLGGLGVDPITAAGLVLPGSGAVAVAYGGAALANISCGAANPGGATCSGSITRAPSTAHSAPELDPASTAAAVTLLVGGFAVLGGWRRRSQSRSP